MSEELEALRAQQREIARKIRELETQPFQHGSVRVRYIPHKSVYRVDQYLLDIRTDGNRFANIFEKQSQEDIIPPLKSLINDLITTLKELEGDNNV